MKTSNLLGSTLVMGMCFMPVSRVMAATVQTLGAGSAASVVDLPANFDSLSYNNVVHLDTYVEGALSVTSSGDSWAGDFAMAAKLDPFHGANSPDRAFYAITSGNEDWVTIQTTNLAKMHGVEFMYGNDWTTGDIYGQYPWGNDKGLEWQTWSDGTLISSGAIGPNPILALGSVVAFYDHGGFDQLLVRCRIDGSLSTNLQALALDNLRVMQTNVPPAAVIYGSDFGLNPTNGLAALTVCDTIMDCQYRLVYTETLASPVVWTPAGQPLPDGWQSGGGTLTLIDPGAAQKAHRFYRVEVR